MGKRIENQIKLQLPSLASSDFMARTTVAAFLKQSNATMEEINDIRTAVSEAVKNCIDHAYPDGIGLIYVNMSLDGRVVRISVCDKGIGIQNVEQARMALFSTLKDNSGMGFTIMESFMDEVRVRSALEKGTTVTMKIQLRNK